MKMSTAKPSTGWSKSAMSSIGSKSSSSGPEMPVPSTPPELVKATVAALLPIIGVVFVAYLVIGLAMPVLPLHVHQRLGLSTFMVGLVVGSQFAAALVSRIWAGHYADGRGAKHAVVAGPERWRTCYMNCGFARLVRVLSHRNFTHRWPISRRTYDDLTISPSQHFGWIGVIFIFLFASVSCNRSQDSKPSRL